MVKSITCSPPLLMTAPTAVPPASTICMVPMLKVTPLSKPPLSTISTALPVSTLAKALPSRSSPVASAKVTADTVPPGPTSTALGIGKTVAPDVSSG